MDFETRMRKLITTLLQPVVAQQTSDSEALSASNRQRDQDVERIRQLEVVVFKDASLATLIDDLRLRIEEGEAMVRKEIAQVADKAENWTKAAQEKIFNVDKRISANEILKEQFELFRMKTEANEKAFTRYKEEVTETFAQTKEQFNTEYKSILHDIHIMKATVFQFSPTLDDVGLKVAHLIEAMKKEDARFELLQRTIIGFEQTKVSATVFGKEMDELKNTLHEFDMRLDDLRDSQKSMQNWVEKYEPLKVQHQITDTLSTCINRKARIKLAEYDLGKCT